MVAIMDPPIVEICRRSPAFQRLEASGGCEVGQGKIPLIDVGCGCSRRKLGRAWNSPTFEDHAYTGRDYPA
jgi:hypothetical protein